MKITVTETKYYQLKNILIKLDNTKRNNQLTIANNFISSKDNGEECVMHLKSDNKIKINNKADEVIEKLFKSFLNRYQ